MNRRLASADLLRELARRRLDKALLSLEEWAKAVEEADEQGFQLLRFDDLVVKISYI
jgi:hypothetical protein